jgi:hypothetical protein
MKCWPQKNTARRNRNRKAWHDLDGNFTEANEGNEKILKPRKPDGEFKPRKTDVWLKFPAFLLRSFAPFRGKQSPFSFALDAAAGGAGPRSQKSDGGLGKRGRAVPALMRNHWPGRRVVRAQAVTCHRTPEKITVRAQVVGYQLKIFFTLDSQCPRWRGTLGARAKG